MRRARAGLLAALAAGGLVLMPAGEARARDRGWDQVTKYIKTSYRAKRQSRFATWLGGLAVKFARPEGVKGVKIALFRELDLARDPQGLGLEGAARAGLGPDWSRVVQVARQGGERTLVFARWQGEDVELMIIAVEPDEAAVVRARVAPDRLSRFVADVKVGAR